MRGNEWQSIREALGVDALFPIPMRGNEPPYGIDFIRDALSSRSP